MKHTRVRKHKQLHALFKQKWVVKLLQENYKTYCALKGLPHDHKSDFKESTAAA